MKKTNKGLMGLFLLLCVLGLPLPASAEWQKPVQPSMTGGALTCLAAHPLDPAKFLLASGHDVFENGPENQWKQLWSQTDASTLIRRIFSFNVLPDFIFVLAGDKVFMGNLKDRSWRTVYKNSDRIPLSFAIHPHDPNHWFLGTRKGLWETKNVGKAWSPSGAFHDSGPVPLLFFDDPRLFIATESALYLSLSGSMAQKVFGLPAIENDFVEEEAEIEDEGAPAYSFRIHDLIASRDSFAKLFLATQDGVFQSEDHGYRWDVLPESGLQNPTVLQLSYSPKAGRLYAATPRGAYSYDARTKHWTGLFEGLARNDVRSIAVLNEEKLIAITGEGFVQSPLEVFMPEAGPVLAIYQPSEKTLLLFKELLSLEPSAREVHKRVIKYADVSNGKIKRWHAGSRIAGMLPTLSLGKDYSTGNSIDLDRGSTSDADQYILGPEDRSKGWSADVSWHLGDMIYSSDQTSIDSREKLMVELRNDLLSEATRIYYERRRLQIGMVFTPPASGQELLEDLLRVDELTTLLDGMTDGFFSERLERLYDERPELGGLWGLNPEGVRRMAYDDKQQNKGG